MKLRQALLYFLQEAGISLVRSWKVSLLAVLTISVSLAICGFLMVLSGNLGSLVEQWQAQTKVVVYLRSGAAPADIEQLRAKLAAVPWVTGVEEVSAEQARRRFQDIFPSLSDLMQDWSEEPLPASLEVAFRNQGLDLAAFTAWSEQVRQNPVVAMVDDDRDWLAQLRTVLAVVRGIGLTLGLVLLAGAIFTIASVVRLTAYLYQDEIEIMRIVGATEFFIRGPFYLEGLLQGFIGGLLALAQLYLGFAVLRARTTGSLWGPLLTGEFLSWEEQLALVLLGATAGLVGAVASLRRQSLRAPSAEEAGAS